MLFISRISEFPEKDNKFRLYKIDLKCIILLQSIIYLNCLCRKNVVLKLIQRNVRKNLFVDKLGKFSRILLWKIGKFLR